MEGTFYPLPLQICEKKLEAMRYPLVPKMILVIAFFLAYSIMSYCLILNRKSSLEDPVSFSDSITSSNRYRFEAVFSPGLESSLKISSIFIIS